MILNVVAILLSSITLGLLGFLIIKIRDKDIKETSSSEYLENKLDVVTKDINEIENQLQSVTAPINELKESYSISSDSQKNFQGSLSSEEPRRPAWICFVISP